LGEKFFERFARKAQAAAYAKRFDFVRSYQFPQGRSAYNEDLAGFGDGENKLWKSIHTHLTERNVQEVLCMNFFLMCAASVTGSRGLEPLSKL
jgi:hypothetical protein